MIKTRIFLLSTVITAVCVAGSYWATWAMEKLRPEEGAVAVYGGLAALPPAPVASASGMARLSPRAVDVRSVQALLQRLRAAHDAGAADWSELCGLADAAVAFGEAAVEPLGKLAADDAEPRGLRLLAVEMLGRIPDPAAVTRLIENLSAARPEDLRLAALAALAKHPVGVQRAAWLFPTLARADAAPGVRARATELLGRHAGPEAVAPLCHALRKDDSPNVRLAAATALGALLDPDAVDTLRDAARLDPDPGVRAAAVEAAGNYLEPRLREFFKSVEAGDASAHVQATARRQLWRIPAD